MVTIGSAGVLVPGKWRRVRTIAWLIALCVAVIFVFNAVAKAALWLAVQGADLELVSMSAAPAAYKLVAAITGLIALLATYWLAVRFGERRAVPELDLRGAAMELSLGLAVGCALLGSIVGTQWLFGWVDIESRPVDSIALALRDSIRSGVLEELVLRLIIFRLLWRAFGIWPALVGAATLFGLLHFGNPDSGFFAAACLIAGEGVGIALYLITGRIWASIGMHAAWNFTQGWILGAVVSGTTDIAGGPFTLRPAENIPELLSGGGFGPEASLAALVVSLLASGAFLWLAWGRGNFVASDG